MVEGVNSSYDILDIRTFENATMYQYPA
jgi:hypothetical protein